jgi:excisionase family DNA binding protein
MQKVIVIAPEDLQELISNSVKEAINPPNSKPTPTRYLGIREASVYLNLSVQTIYRFTSKGKIPFLKKGKKLLFLESDLDACLNSKS